MSSKKRTDVPTGGFPPIIICDKKKDIGQKKEISKKKFTASKTSINIVDIIAKRKKKPSFLNF